MDIQTITIQEVVQAGDVFLLHLSCPQCQSALFISHDKGQCPNCDFPIKLHALRLPTHRSKFRTLVGTKRKSIVNKKIVQQLYELQEKQCAYCYCDLENTAYEVEHIVPISFGGTNNLANLVISCKSCNSKAGSLIFSSFQSKQAYVTSKLKS
jgi:5-methylcytosine-specific restriction endonuclease McrA